MKAVTKYQCEICKQIYNERAEATACEESHTEPKEVWLPKGYKPVIDESYGYPRSVIVKMKNGKCALYYYQRPCGANDFTDEQGG